EALSVATLALGMAWAATASGASISSGTFTVQTGNFGEISSLQIVGDTFPTNYVINATNAPSLAGSADHHWFGELMFRYRLGTTTTWSTANSNNSDDGRTIASTASSVTVTYQNSANANGIKNFKVVESYSLVNDYLYWQVTVTNTSSQSLE